MAKRRSYTKEEREAVLADVPALGVVEASRKHGVPQTTVTQWAKAAGVHREAERSRSSAPTPTAARKLEREAKGVPADVVIFEAKDRVGTLPLGADARCLLCIVKNLGDERAGTGAAFGGEIGGSYGNRYCFRRPLVIDRFFWRDF
ncbi:transposase [Sorangium sp. So ce1128]